MEEQKVSPGLSQLPPEKSFRTSDIMNKSRQSSISGRSSSFHNNNDDGSSNSSNTNNMSQNLESRRARNMSFVKVLNRRQQIRDRFKNEFFSNIKNKKKQEEGGTPNVCIKMIEKDGQADITPFDATEQQNGYNYPINIMNNRTSVESIDIWPNAKTTSIDYCGGSLLDKDEIIRRESLQLSEDSNNQDQHIFLHVESKIDINDLEEDKKNGIFHISRGETFDSIYELQDVLGEGCVGLVKRAVKISDRREQYAVKMVRTRDEETIMNIKNEFLHLKELSHKNIVKVYEIYIDKHKGKIYTVMELIKGKEMFEVINKLGSYSEEIAKKIFKQICEAISYMHSKYVCHRDLKPNNILCNETGENVKITDFNVSKFSDSYKDYTNTELPYQGIKMWTYTGTIAFSAPEIFQETCYDESIDIWSAGVILYTMLCGKEPFQAEFVQDLIQLIIKGQYSFPSDPWDEISSEAKDLIKKCLTISPEDRIKPDDMLTHPWIIKDQKKKSRLSCELDRNQLQENLERLVKGGTTQQQRSLTRKARSNTLCIPSSLFKNSDYMFSIKCFESPTAHSEDENDDPDNPNDLFVLQQTMSADKPTQKQWQQVQQQPQSSNPLGYGIQNRLQSKSDETTREISQGDSGKTTLLPEFEIRPRSTLKSSSPNKDPKLDGLNTNKTKEVYFAPGTISPTNAGNIMHNHQPLTSLKPLLSKTDNQTAAVNQQDSNFQHFSNQTNQNENSNDNATRPFRLSSSNFAEDDELLTISEEQNTSQEQKQNQK